MEVRDLLLTPPTDHPYDTLKTQLIKCTAASEQRKLQQLISGEELGDRKPTQLLRRMQQLLGDKLTSGADSTSFLRELFLQRLPANVRMVLASADSTTTLDKLAEMADKVMEVVTPVVAAVGHAHTESSVEVKQLRKEVAHLTNLVTVLTTSNTPSARHSRSNSRRFRSSPAPKDSIQSANSLCWYHAKFGEAAQKCKEPCNWGNSTAGP